MIKNAPCFDKLEVMLALAMLSIAATKCFEIGSGFGGYEVVGSVHNDPFVLAEPESHLRSSVPSSGAAKAGIP